MCMQKAKMVSGKTKKQLTDYELRRLENLKRNQQVLASFNLQSKATQLFAPSRPQKSRRFEGSKIKNIAPARKSLRALGIEAEILTPDSPEPAESPELKKSRYLLDPCLLKCSDPVSMSDAFIGIKSKSDNQGFLDKIKGISENTRSVHGSPSLPIDLGLMELKPHNITRVVPGEETLVRFLPSENSRVIVAGNRYGNIGFWDVAKEEEDGVYCYQPHIGAISGISIQPNFLSRIYTSCDKGFIRMMDVEKETFNLVYSSDLPIQSLSHHPTDLNCLYFGEGHGKLSMWDSRGTKSSLWTLHSRSITSLDFNSKNPYIMTTSSLDGDACIWDLRSIDAGKPKSLKVISHKRGVYSACFSPSGNYLAVASAGNALSILGGVDFNDFSLMYHDHKAGEGFSFRAIWGWDDSHVLIGNREGGIDIMSATERKKIRTLQSPYLSAIVHQLDPHPYQAGLLAGSAGKNKAFMWTLSPIKLDPSSVSAE